jgi:hypothetical protein
MSDELVQFVSWLQTDLTHFVAIVEEGSWVTGDPWQKGFSDHDLNVVVRTDIQSEMRAVYNYLEAHPLGNEYLTGLRLADEFAVGDSLNDLSFKFRSKSLAGEDVIASKAVPSREKALKTGHDELEYLLTRFERRWLNLAQWSNEYAQKKNYEIFKNFFVYFSALEYGKTGVYPVRRADAAKLLDDQIAANSLLGVTNNIGTASKSEQKAAIEAAFALINSVLAA